MIRKYEINKYPPSLFKHGKFLSEDWTSCSDIGKPTLKGTLSKAEYLHVECSYLSAVLAVAGTAQPNTLRAHNIESWELESEDLSKLGLDEVLDGSAAPAECEAVSGDRLENIARRCLREVAWLELVAPPLLLIHFGYDLRIVIASSLDLDNVLKDVKAMGLFVYDSSAQLPTVESWS